MWLSYFADDASPAAVSWRTWGAYAIVNGTGTPAGVFAPDTTRAFVSSLPHEADMGLQVDEQEQDPQRMRQFMKQLLNDVRAKSALWAAQACRVGRVTRMCLVGLDALRSP